MVGLVAVGHGRVSPSRLCLETAALVEFLVMVEIQTAHLGLLQGAEVQGVLILTVEQVVLEECLYLLLQVKYQPQISWKIQQHHPVLRQCSKREVKMIKRYAVIIDQKVTNVILIDDVDYDNYTSLFDPNTYLFVEVEETSEVSIGWLYTDNEFINMNPIINNEQKIVDEIIQQIANS
jgi:hypothetical protein